MLLAGFLLAALLTTAAQAATHKVTVVMVDQEITATLARRVQRDISRASADPAVVGILVEIDTPGGEVTAMDNIKDAIMGAGKPVAAWVRAHAWSAGSLIAMSADKLYMRPGSSIGAAEPRLSNPLGGGLTPETDPKVTSALTGEFRAVAKARGRNADVAAKMVDKSLKVPGFEADKLVTLDYQQAVDLKLADGIAADRATVLQQMGWGDTVADLPTSAPTDELARLFSEPWIAVLLLALGVAAIGFEFFHPGMTVPALVGVVFLALFFGSNIIVGNAPWWVVALFVGGLGFLGVEMFIPGHGLMGLMGLVAMLGAVFFSVPNHMLALGYMAAMLVAATVLVVGIARRITVQGLPAWLTNAEQQGAATGYVAPRAERAADLVGAHGLASTVLRPAGIAEFGNRKVDVVTEGDFLPAGSEVEVVRVEGTRVVVRRAAEQHVR